MTSASAPDALTDAVFRRLEDLMGVQKPSSGHGSTVVEAGSRVVLHGLVKRADLNGRKGSITAFDAAKGRYAVTFETGEAALLKPQNLSPVASANF